MLYCPLPWIHQSIKNDGVMRVCCQSNQGPDRGLLRKDDGSVYNAGIDDLNEARNCKKLKDIRLCMLKGEWHEECIRCKNESLAGMRTRPIFEEDAWGHIISQSAYKNVTNNDGSIDINKMPVVYLDVRFGNKCNLKCRMCGPTDSSLWLEDYVKVWDKYTYHETTDEIKIILDNGIYRADTDRYNWYENEDFWKQLKEYIPHIKLVQIVGGEPLLINQQFNFLKECIDMNESKHIAIEYNSNIYYIPEKAWDLWKKFKTIRIGASVDGLNLVNDYIRYPSQWSVIEKNLHKLDNADGNFQLWIAYTVQILNILELPKFMQWKLAQNFKRINITKTKPIINAHPLHGPHFLNIRAFPYDIKLKIKERLKTYKFEKSPDQATAIINEYCNYMFQEDYSQTLPTFWKYNNKLDEIRNQKLQDYIPELYELIGGTNV